MPGSSVHFAGRCLDLNDPGVLDIAAVATTLSRICRFAGNLRDDHPVSWHSVADHCVLTAELLRRRDMPAQICLAGLLHDAHEALIGDVITPTKEWLAGGGYGAAYAKRKEHDLERKVMDGLGCKVGTYARIQVKQADWDALAIEVTALGLPPAPFGLRTVAYADPVMLSGLGILQPSAHLTMGEVFQASRQRFLDAYASLQAAIASAPALVEPAHA